MFTKIAICYLRNRIEKQIDNEDEKLIANAFLNLIEQFLKKNNWVLLYFFKKDVYMTLIIGEHFIKS